MEVFPDDWFALINNFITRGFWDEGLPILQYVDDMIQLMEYHLEKAKNQELILSMFEWLSELKINVHKN
jgi:hypothetical protein